MSCWVVVVAGGSGSRFGGPKQIADVGGMRVVDRSLQTARSVADGVVLVWSGPDVGSVEADVVVAGGTTRSASVRAGLAVIPDDVEVIVIHDAARPLATAELFHSVIDAVRGGASAAIPAVPVTDTIRRVGGGVVDRSELRAVQTPQAFDALALRAAHVDAPEATDDAGVVEANGGTVVLVDGEAPNLKITEPADLAVATALLGHRSASGEPS